MKGIKYFARDENGFVLVYGTMIIALLLGFAILAVDVSRFHSHHTQLQKAADAAALSAGAELDGKPDAIERATRAINAIASTTFQNRSIFGTVEAATIRIDPQLDVRFFERLPVVGDMSTATGAGDNQPIASDGNAATNDPSKANFVEIRVGRELQGGFINTIMPLGIVGGNSNTVNSAAVAVAGGVTADEVWCEPTPLFICNPYETAPGNGRSQLEVAIKDGSLRKRLLMLRQVNGNEGQYSPGNFGLLLPPTGNGANAVLDLLARTSSGFCVRQHGVELKTGTLDPVRSAINVRFDIWDQVFNNKRNDPSYAPAPNIRKGYQYTGNACNASYWERTSTDPATGQKKTETSFDRPPDVSATPAPDLSTVRPYQPLPLDECMYTNSCPTAPFSPQMAGRIGDGKWNFDAYWKVNYPGVPPPNGWSNTNLPSRYEVYLYELANQAVLSNPSDGTDGAGPKGEVGAPMCSRKPGDAKRRVIHAALLNCMELDADPRYGPLNGAQSGKLPAEALAEFFLVQPILPQNFPNDADAAKKLYAEIIDIKKPATLADMQAPNGAGQPKILPVVRLYR